MTDIPRSPAVEFLKHYWFLVLFSLSAIGVVMTLWFDGRKSNKPGENVALR